MTVDVLRALRGQFSGLDLDVLDWVIEDLQQARSVVAGDIYLDGLTNVLAEPEFSGSEEARRALRLFEERSLLQDLLARTVLSANAGGVQVLIGGEGTFQELRQTSLILTRYGAPGLATGTLGVLGPMRLPYGRTISTMRFLSGLLSDLVSESLVEDEGGTLSAPDS
jgi:heat-inducible transcriptional repressor